LGDIVVGDIGQPQYYKCTKKKPIEKERRKSLVTLWLTSVINVINHNVTQVLPVK